MRYRILIIEDEPAIADNIIYALETEGFEFLWCATGKEALDALETKFDFVVLDIGLPDIGGFELCKLIRIKYSLPILFLTARASEIDRVVGLEIGADDYMVKPFSPRELVARIKAILRRTIPVSENKRELVPKIPLSKTPFQIDEERHRISFFGKFLELSRTEFRLMEALIHKPGRVWTREQLMAKAWDSPESSMDRTVDAHIKILRSKLRELDATFDPIQTHRGIGYSLKEDW